jgi:predicted nucleic acid-binding protein
MLRLIIDSNVLTSAFRSQSGASFALIEFVRREWVRMLATPPLFLEYADSDEASHRFRRKPATCSD